MIMADRQLHAHAVGSVADLSERRRRALRISLVANAGFMVVEIVGGVAFGSLALLADATHMFADVAALGIALIAQQLVDRPASVRHTFGLQRAEVLGAQINGLLLLVTAGWILYEASRRLSQPTEIDGGGLLLVASLGFAVNVACAVLLARTGGSSLNMRGALLHMIADAASSVGAIVAGFAVLLFDSTWVDPVVSVLIGALVVWTGWNMLRATTHVLLEGAPGHIDPQQVERFLADFPGVSSVHHVHLWHLTSESAALSAHVVLEGEPTLHQAQTRGDNLKGQLADRFAISHATLELECHDCEPDDCGAADRAPARDG